MDSIIVRGLCDRQYEIRKKAALQLEKQIKYIYYEEQDTNKLNKIIRQLTDHNPSINTDNNDNGNIDDYSNSLKDDFSLKNNNKEDLATHDMNATDEVESNNKILKTTDSNNNNNNAGEFEENSSTANRDSINNPDFDDKLSDANGSNDTVSIFPSNIDVTTIRIAKLMAYASIIISLGQANSAPFIKKIIPSMLPFFYDPNDLVRFYSCESLYNIAKILKGEILVYFNEIFDILCSVTVDPINNVKGAASILDKLIKDIVIEFGSDYISFLQLDDDILNTTSVINKNAFIGNKLSDNIRYKDIIEQHKNGMLSIGGDFVQPPSSKLRQPNNSTIQLNKFIPLLLERIYSNNSNTKVFLLSWIDVLNKCPNLTLVTFLPWLINAILLYLDDSVNSLEINELVNNLLNGMLLEVQNLGDIRMRQFNKEQLQQVNTKKKLNNNSKRISSLDSTSSSKSINNSKKVIDGGLSIQERKKSLIINNMSIDDDTKNDIVEDGEELGNKSASSDNSQVSEEDTNGQSTVTENLGEEYVNKPYLNIKKLTSTLIKSLSSSNQKIQKLVINWISNIITHWPIDDILKINKKNDLNKPELKDQDLSDLITLLLRLGNSATNKTKDFTHEEPLSDDIKYIDNMRQKQKQSGGSRDSVSKSANTNNIANAAYNLNYKLLELLNLTQDRLLINSLSLSLPITSLINNLVLTFKESNYENKVLILNWLNFLYSNFIDETNCDHFNDNCFLILVKALNYEEDAKSNDSIDDVLVESSHSISTSVSEIGTSDKKNDIIKNKDTKYLFLLNKSLNLLKLVNSLDPNDSYFNRFLNQLLNNWEESFNEKTNKRDTIFINLCNSLGSEKLYKNLSLLLDSRYKSQKNFAFTSDIINMMAKKMIVSKELYPLRIKLRTNDDWSFFTILFKSWCIQPSALIFLCLISENYELGYNIILGMTTIEEILPKNLMQLDILVQLMESQSMTQMRMDLLMNDKQYLIKLLYSILMLLPQSSSAFSLLNNRLNSISQFKNMSVSSSSSPRSISSSTRSISVNSNKSIMTSNNFQFVDLLEYYNNVINNI
ncbi:hypothetical protein ACO0SA_002114 [Hanseniaspora valbyensis]